MTAVGLASFARLPREGAVGAVLTYVRAIRTGRAATTVAAGPTVTILESHVAAATAAPVTGRPTSPAGTTVPANTLAARPTRRCVTASPTGPTVTAATAGSAITTVAAVRYEHSIETVSSVTTGPAGPTVAAGTAGPAIAGVGPTRAAGPTGPAVTSILTGGTG